MRWITREHSQNILSLTLVIIIITGSVSVAFPQISPVSINEVFASHNANLFVSAENSLFNNYMSGPQVIEVVIIDSDINDINVPKGEPDVTINGKKLRMVQATDGNWYGYFADRDMAQIADSTVAGNPAGEGLDFGNFCSNQLGLGEGTSIVDFIDTSGVAVGFGLTGSLADGSVTGGPITASCTTTNTTPAVVGDTQNVLRENNAINLIVPGGANGNGQIGIADNAWPFIQLYTLNPTGNVVVQYNKGGGAQSTTLTFDTVDQFANLVISPSLLPPGQDIQFTLTDIQLNIDPTDEDSWTFGTLSGLLELRYQLFDENGIADAACVLGNTACLTTSDYGPSPSQELIPSLSSLMFGTNGVLIINTSPSGPQVIDFKDNDDQIFSVLSGNVPQPVTVIETTKTSGTFVNFDNSNVANLFVPLSAPNGSNGIITYNNIPNSVVVITPISSTFLNKTANATSIFTGQSVTFTYTETNDGNQPLTNVSVSDNQCSPVIPIFSGGFNIGDTNNNNVLDPGEAWTFECTETFPTAGIFTNTATGNGTNPVGQFITYPFDLQERANATVNVITPLFCGLPLSSYGTNVFNGGPSSDVLIGTPSMDLIQGFGGNDTIQGLGGNDCLIGGDGNDTINGGKGNDTINGNAGDDVIKGGKGNDTINGNAGNDTINGDSGDDQLFGNDGVDNLIGGLGNNDFCDGGAGIDTSLTCENIVAIP